jgi:hypothetical protein
MVFEGLRKFFSHWGWEWGSAGALKSLKIQVFLIGDGNWGTVGDALIALSLGGYKYVVAGLGSYS